MKLLFVILMRSIFWYFWFLSVAVISVYIWIGGKGFMRQPANGASTADKYVSVFVWFVLLTIGTLAAYRSARHDYKLWKMVRRKL